MFKRRMVVVAQKDEFQTWQGQVLMTNWMYEGEKGRRQGRCQIWGTG